MSARLNSQFLYASVSEFIYVWALHGNSSLSLTTSNGQATVSFNCTLGHPGAPHSHPPTLSSSPPHRKPRHRGPAERERNRQRAARHQAARASPSSPATPISGTAPVNTVPPTSTLTASVTTTFTTASVTSSQTKQSDHIPQIYGNIEDSAKEESFKQHFNFLCDHCEHKTTYEKELMQHVKFNHEGFKCDYCKYKNNSKDIIKEHMNKHKNGRTRSLPGRPRNFSPISTFEDEMDSAHIPTADDPYNIFDSYMNQLNQEKIENMSKTDVIHLKAEIACKVALQDVSKIAK